MPQASRTRISKETADQQLADGLAKHAAVIGGFIVAGKSYTVAQTIAIILGCVAASKEVAVKRAALEAALAAEQTTRDQNKVFASAVKQTLQAMFLGHADILGDLGLRGRKARVVSPKTQVAAAARARATRELRGTKGAKQKRGIQAPPVVEVSTKT